MDAELSGSDTAGGSELAHHNVKPTLRQPKATAAVSARSRRSLRLVDIVILCGSYYFRIVVPITSSFVSCVVSESSLRITAWDFLTGSSL